jgi:uncharacterized protein YndB with AHSA1/START domain
MNAISNESRSVVVERDFPYPPEKVWRALTQPHLIAEWLMKNDFAPTVGHAFKLVGDWGSVDGRVEVIEPERLLSYTWSAMGLESIVTWTLAATATGTRVRMEHAGFPMDRDQAYQGASYGWQRFIGSLEQVLARDA